MVAARHILTVALLAGAVGLGGRGWAKPPEKPQPTSTAAPTTTRGAFDFTAIDARIASGDWKGALDDIEAVLSDPVKTGAEAGAWGRLGRALHAGGLPYAALAAWLHGAEIKAADVGADYPDLLKAVATTGDGLWAGRVLGQDFSVPMDDATRSQVALLAARHHIAQGSWGTALGMLAMVQRGSAWDTDATMLRGVAMAQQSRFEDALAPLLEARELARSRDEHFRATLDLNIARTYYGANNFGRAMEYYARVPRSDSAWPEAHFERAWAHYRVDDMSGAVGLLLTHTSPFFEDWYFPEAQLLKAQALFLMCKFPEVTKTIDAFEAQYKPILATLDAQVGAMDAAAAYEDARAFLDGKPTKLPAPLLRRLSWDVRFQQAIDGIRLADDDVAKLDRIGSPAAARVKKALLQRRDARIAEEGGRVLAWAQDAKADLVDMMQGLALTRVDLLTFEADLYERAAVTGKLEELGDKVGQVRKEKPRKGKLTWPFEGEYWADELGWYRVTARPDCPANMARGDQ